MQLVEQVGSGIIRMRNLMKEAGLHVPEFSTEGMFTITLQRQKIGIANSDKLGDKLGDKTGDGTRVKIVEILKTNNQTTITELAELLNISYKGVEYHITEMKKEGILKRIGSRKNGSWEVTDK
jgi:ATP-dependent DNA helicase RecG